MKKICHLTTVHDRQDPRISSKQCNSLSKLYDVSLVVSDGKGSDYTGNFQIIDIGKPSNRFTRIFIKTLKLFFVALKQKASIYQFHDPELIPVGLFLKLFGKKVIYDVHEDYVTSIKSKDFIPKPLRIFIGSFWNFFERFSAQFFTIIIAEKYYKDRFKNGLEILNYPIGNITIKTIREFKSKTLLYTGNITELRGAINLANLLNYDKELKIRLVGRCEIELADRMYSIAGKNKDRLEIIGINEYIPFDKILAEYKKDDWIAGVALFPPDRHYEKKELTKFFEYMAVGLPIIASDFEYWKTIIEEKNIGINVDASNYPEVINKINYLWKNKQIANEFSKNGLILANSEYNWACEEIKLFKLYDTLN